jgi:WD40 repeat protein
MSGKVTRGLCALAAGTALAAFTLVTAGAAGAAPGAARSLAAAGTGRPAGAPGSQLWVRLYNGPGNSFDAASSVVVSPGGSRVFVTGESQGTRSGLDYATVAYSVVTGARLWAARYNGQGNSFDAASSVAVSPGGATVYVTGTSYGGAATGDDYATVAYSAATGARLWVQRYNGPGHGNDAASSVAVSPGGSRVFVTGASQGTRSGPDYATVAYSAATGARLWVQRYNGPANGNDAASSVAVSPGGSRVFVTGGSQGTRSGPDYATVAYSAATGARLWVTRYNSPANGDDAARSVAVSPGGSRVYVTGGSYPGSATLAYSAATGAQLWLARHNDMLLAAVAVSPGGSRVYVTGLTGPFRYDYATVAHSAG